MYYSCFGLKFLHYKIVLNYQETFTYILRQVLNYQETFTYILRQVLNYQEAFTYILRQVLNYQETFTYLINKGSYMSFSINLYQMSLERVNKQVS